MMTNDPFRDMIRAGKTIPAHVRIARAVKDVTDCTVDQAIKAGEVLYNQGLTPHQVRTNYRAAGITYDMVQEALNDY